MEKDLMRPMVAKYLPRFTAYVKQHGSEMVKQCLIKGHHHNCKLTALPNKKDRYQMLQMLDLL